MGCYTMIRRIASALELALCLGGAWCLAVSAVVETQRS